MFVSCLTKKKVHVTEASPNLSNLDLKSKFSKFRKVDNNKLEDLNNCSKNTFASKGKKTTNHESFVFWFLCCKNVKSLFLSFFALSFVNHCLKLFFVFDV